MSQFINLVMNPGVTPNHLPFVLGNTYNLFVLQYYNKAEEERGNRGNKINIKQGKEMHGRVKGYCVHAKSSLYLLQKRFR